MISRPLRYPGDWPASPPQEKGVDTALSVDFVIGAVKAWYDVGVILSRDSDPRPAIETVPTQLHGLRVEGIAWNRPDVDCGRLSIPGRRLWCHWLDESGPSPTSTTTTEGRRDQVSPTTFPSASTSTFMNPGVAPRPGIVRISPSIG